MVVRVREVRFGLLTSDLDIDNVVNDCSDENIVHIHSHCFFSVHILCDLIRVIVFAHTNIACAPALIIGVVSINLDCFVDGVFLTLVELLLELLSKLPLLGSELYLY